MRALVLDKPGTPDTLHLSELPTPEPRPGQVRVRVLACGLNPSDYQRAQFGMPGWEWPAILGLDVVGLVDALAPDVEAIGLGERVVFHGHVQARGGLAQYTLADAATLTRVPEGVASVAAAAIPAAGMTAYQAVIRRLRVASGDTVLVTAGAGGVGGFAVQLAAGAGARVIATESAQNADRARELGADAVLDFRADDIAARVRELTDGRGVDAVVDTIGPESATANLQLLVHGGGMAAIAGRPDLSALPPFGVAPSVHEIALGAAYLIGDERAVRDLPRMLEQLLDLVDQGRLDPMVSRVVTLHQVPAALTELSERRLHGKLVACLE
jgi:NADPH:quinone reductase-like Zn-dependent oxidoreductase